jgi:hypothetical protein
MEDKEQRMSEELEQSRVKRERVSETQRKAGAFREVPGEDEANAVRDAFIKRAGQSTGDVASKLGSADIETRARVLNRLQQERGNAYVRRVVDEAKGTPGRLVGLSQPEMVGEVTQRRGSGSPLTGGTKEQMEGFFGADLSGVQVHSGGESATLNRELNAQAFTVGRDVFFAEGKYDPTSSEGQGLLAHELTHVQQQGGFGASGAQRAEGEEEEVQAKAEEEEVQEEAQEGVQRQEVPEEEEQT